MPTVWLAFGTIMVAAFVCIGAAFTAVLAAFVVVRRRRRLQAKTSVARSAPRT